MMVKRIRGSMKHNYKMQIETRRENIALKPGFETHVEGHVKSKMGAISGSTKWTLDQL